MTVAPCDCGHSAESHEGHEVAAGWCTECSCTRYEPAQQLYYILDARQVVGNCAYWWRPDSAGYTTELEKAGLYTACPSDRETDVLVPQHLAQELAVRHVRLDHLRARLGSRKA